MKNDIFVKLADRWKDVDYMESETDVPEIKGLKIHAKSLYYLIAKIPDLSITRAIVNSSPELKFHLKKSRNSTFLAITDESWLSIFSYDEFDATPTKFQEAVLYGLIQGKYINYRNSQYAQEGFAIYDFIKKDYINYRNGQYIQNINNDELIVERDRDQIYIENIRLRINNATYTTATDCVLYLI
jgi:hypothetical protein